jgi:hypothetical protein
MNHEHISRFYTIDELIEIIKSIDYLIISCEKYFKCTKLYELKSNYLNVISIIRTKKIDKILN